MVRPLAVIVPVWILVAGGSGYLLSRAERVDPAAVWTLSRDVAANHQVQEHELVGPRSRTLLARLAPKESLTGRHLVRHKKRGEAIAVEDLASQPGFATVAGAGVVLYDLESEKQIADGVVVGSWVRPCFTRPSQPASQQTQTHCVKDAVSVEAVHRPAATGDRTWLALRIPHGLLPEIGEFLARDNRFLLLAEGPPVTHYHP